jgi:hypothetical protein
MRSALSEAREDGQAPKSTAVLCKGRVGSRSSAFGEDVDAPGSRLTGAMSDEVVAATGLGPGCREKHARKQWHCCHRQSLHPAKIEAGCHRGWRSDLNTEAREANSMTNPCQTKRQAKCGVASSARASKTTLWHSLLRGLLQVVGQDQNNPAILSRIIISVDITQKCVTLKNTAGTLSPLPPEPPAFPEYERHARPAPLFLPELYWPLPPQFPSRRWSLCTRPHP